MVKTIVCRFGLIYFQCCIAFSVCLFVHFSDFGENEIVKLANYFREPLTKAGVDINKIPDQWTALKSLVCYNI